MSGIEVLVITADPITSEAVLNPWDDGTVHVSASTTEGMRFVDSNKVDVVALDYNGKLDNLEFALSDIRDLAPTVALLVLCDKNQVSKITESEASASIFRILPKPLAIGQSQLAFKSAYEQHLELEARLASGENLSIPLATEEHPPQLKYLFFLCLITLTAWFAYELFSESENPERVGQTEPKPQNQTVNVISSENDQLDQLYNLAQEAVNNLDLKNAATLYDQMLEMDAYDGNALAGHESIKKLLTDRIETAIESNNLLEAQNQLADLSQIYPDYKGTSELSTQLAQLAPKSAAQPKIVNVQDSSNSINEDPPVEGRTEISTTPIPTNPSENISRQEAAAVDDKIVLPPDLVLEKIDTALQSSTDSQLLISDAYRLLLAKVSIGPLSPEYSERLDKLAQRLRDLGDNLISQNEPDDLRSLTQSIRSFPSLIELANSLDQDMDTASRSIIKEPGVTDNIAKTQPIIVPPSTSVVMAASSKVIPAVKVSGNNPKYPKNAERRGIEGFVELEFTITQMGEVTSVAVTRTVPEGVFNEAAITAVSSWRYQPRLVDNQPVSERKQIRLGFRL
jgi:TonB family protein